MYSLTQNAFRGWLRSFLGLLRGENVGILEPALTPKIVLKHEKMHLKMQKVSSHLWGIYIGYEKTSKKS